MPRDAPVTSATAPGQIESCCDSRQAPPSAASSAAPARRRRSTLTTVTLRSIFLTRPASTVPGPTSTYVRDAFATQGAARRPPSAPATTPGGSAPRSRRGASRFGSASTLATTGTRGSARRERAQLRREPLLGRLHQRAVERRADRQRNHALGAERLRALAGARDRVGVPGDHDLARRVQVRRRHDRPRHSRAPRRTPARRRRRRARGSPPSRPSPTGTASCM